VRDAFGPEIAQLYKTLRSNGTLSYAEVERRFEEHQAKWPEALFNEDAWIKYVGPLVSPMPGKTPTTSYLSMMQGSKEEQRKWWLYNRFRYMDSKWNAGDAFGNIIELRGYAKANITITPYSDIYPSVKFGSYTVSERGAHGVATTLVCPLDSVNDTEIHIYSAPQLASVGDLSPLKVGRADFRAAVNLQSIVVGSGASGYTNQNLTELFVGNNSLLRTIDARNCTALTGAVDFSGATSIEHVYMDGTAVTSVALPIGGILKTLTLPSTITNLTVRNQPAITTFSVTDDDFSNVTTLRVENCSDAIPYVDILSDMPTNSRVRIIGFEDEVDTVTELNALFDTLKQLRGLDENGNNVDEAVVGGTIALHDTVTRGWIAKQAEAFPYITIVADTVLDDDSSILDSWADIITATENGTYATKYEIGDTKSLDFGSEGAVLMELVAFDTDELASDATQTAATTWIAKASTVQCAYGGNSSTWIYNSTISYYLSNTIFPLVPSVVASAIKQVTKYTHCTYTGGTKPDNTKRNYATTESLWVPSLREIYSGFTSDPALIETVGVAYDDAFPNNASRIRGGYWWLRTRVNGRAPYCVNTDGGVSTANAQTASYKLILGFCI
jgi:hypothetical protein